MDLFFVPPHLPRAATVFGRHTATVDARCSAPYRRARAVAVVPRRARTRTLLPHYTTHTRRRAAALTALHTAILPPFPPHPLHYFYLWFGGLLIHFSWSNSLWLRLLLYLLLKHSFV